MRIEFHGAAGGEVTGSCHLIEVAGKRILFDCGMVQGGHEADVRNAEPFAFDPASIDALVISHAHIDHIGRVPLLLKRGFRGAIHAQDATADLMRIMLLDSASIAESEAERGNRKRRAGEPELQPLYTREDVEETMRRVRPLRYDTDSEILPGVRLTFREAGHILGSSVVELRAEGRTLVFSGDLGPKGTPILRDPEPIAAADLVLMESTYGDRLHKDRAETILELGRILEAAWNDGGNVLIPAFAVGRSQELLYWFAKYWDEWKLSRWKIFLDSPMAAKVMAVYDKHEELFDAEAAAVWRGRIKPFHLPNLRAGASVEDSKAINRVHGGAIIIAGSGMANGGRVRHHLANNLAFARNHVIFVGYQATGTLGRLLVNGVKHVRMYGEDIPVRANIHTVGGLSAHADQQGLLEWYGANPNHPPVALAHGENPAREALAALLKQRFGTTVTLSQPGMQLEV